MKRLISVGILGFSMLAYGFGGAALAKPVSELPAWVFTPPVGGAVGSSEMRLASLVEALAELQRSIDSKVTSMVKDTNITEDAGSGDATQQELVSKTPATHFLCGVEIQGLLKDYRVESKESGELMESETVFVGKLIVRDGEGVMVKWYRSEGAALDGKKFAETHLAATLKNSSVSEVLARIRGAGCRVTEVFQGGFFHTLVVQEGAVEKP